MKLAPLTPKFWDDLPAADSLDRVVAQLERATNSSSLKGKLVDWGWQSSSGETLDRFHWWLRREQKWI